MADLPQPASAMDPDLKTSEGSSYAPRPLAPGSFTGMVNNVRPDLLKIFSLS